MARKFAILLLLVRLAELNVVETSIKKTDKIDITCKIESISHKQNYGLRTPEFGRELNHVYESKDKRLYETEDFRESGENTDFCYKQRQYYFQQRLDKGNDKFKEQNEKKDMNIKRAYRTINDSKKVSNSKLSKMNADILKDAQKDEEFDFERPAAEKHKKQDIEPTAKVKSTSTQNNNEIREEISGGNARIAKIENTRLQDVHRSDMNESEDKKDETKADSDERLELKDAAFRSRSFSPPGHMKKLGEHKQAETDSGVEVLDYVPNGKDFYMHFIRKRRPLFMKGAAKSWRAVRHWNNETYLKEKYGGIVFDVEYRKIQSAAEYPIKKTMNMTEFLSLYKHIPMYLDSPFPQSNLTNDIFIPYCMQCEEIFSTISSVHLLFSSGGTSSAFHQDGYDNLLTVISGRKEVVVINSNYSEDLYADDFETIPGLSPVNPEAVDLVKFPRVANVPFHKIVLNPGDILFIPMHWWHHVRSYESPNIGITLWFFQFPGMESLVEEEYISYKSVVEEGKRFARVVEMYPDTIECRNQNLPLSNFYNPLKK